LNAAFTCAERLTQALILVALLVAAASIIRFREF